MSKVRFEIKFDNLHVTYSSGQHVTGEVIIELRKEKRFRGIELLLFGGARVRWTEGGGKNRRTYTAREIYVENSIYIVGGPNSDIALPAGIHKYPFRLILPTGIPSSYESKYGHVRYTVKAAMRRPWRFDHKCKAAITVLNPLDLNNQPGASEPVQTTTEKKLWFGFGSPIKAVVSVPFLGYVPGQRCQGTCEVDNPTGNGISAKAHLVQGVTFTSKHGRKKVKRKVLSEEQIGNVNPHSTRTSSFCLQVPALPDSYLNHCTYIDIYYYIEITGNITGFHRNLHAIVPIVIGSIPPRTQFAYMTWEPQCPPSQMKGEHSNVPHRMETDLQEISPVVCAMQGPFLQYPEMPPPTYEECVGGKINIQNEEDDEHVQGVMEFAPRYPVYSFKETNS